MPMPLGCGVSVRPMSVEVRPVPVVVRIIMRVLVLRMAMVERNCIAVIVEHGRGGTEAPGYGEIATVWPRTRKASQPIKIAATMSQSIEAVSVGFQQLNTRR